MPNITAGFSWVMGTLWAGAVIFAATFGALTVFSIVTQWWQNRQKDYQEYVAELRKKAQEKGGQ